MTLPKISVVTPSFNQGQFLEETVQSILQQDYPNLEYVIIDGGSNDNSVDIIKKYEDKLHFWVSEKDEGHGDAIEKGFAHTSGEIMAWLNSDDKYTPWCFSVVAEIFSKFPQVMWIVGFNSWWNSAGAMTHAARGPKNIYDFLLGNFAWVQQESVFWRRELWDKAGSNINQEYKLMIDGELWTRFFLHADLHSVDCILGGYREHSDNRAKHNYAECLQEMEKAISIMRPKCSPSVLETYTQLQACAQARKVLYPAAFKSAAYNNIVFHNDAWVERKMQFNVKQQ